MFGVLGKASCGMAPVYRRAWMGHICGLCLALRDRFGHLARLTTTYDTAVLSVLYEAQTEPQNSYISYCPLRRHWKQPVVAPTSLGARYAASLSLLAGATKIQDHLADRETFLPYIPVIPGYIAQNWWQKGQQVADTLGFNSITLIEQIQRQAQVERQSGQGFWVYAQPTEVSTAVAFRHTAVLAQHPENEPWLYHMGAMFGRLIYLLDSYQDYSADVAAHKFNALAACYPANERKVRARNLFHQAYTELKEAFSRLHLARPELAQEVLVNGLKRIGHRVFGHTCTVPSLLASESDLPEDEPGDGLEPAYKKRRAHTRHDDGCGYFDCGDGGDMDCIACCDCCGCCCDCGDCGDSVDCCGGADGCDCNCDCG